MINFVPAQFYSLVYLVAISIVSIFYFFVLAPMSNQTLLDKKKPVASGLILAIILTLYIGLRPVSDFFFGDMWAYYIIYRQYAAGEAIPEYTTDILFNWIQYKMALYFEVEYFFLLICAIYTLCIYFACRRFSEENSTILFLFAASAMGFFSYATNGIRNGAASSIFILALSFFYGSKKDKIVFLLLSLAAFMFHSSILVPILAVIAAAVIKNPKLMFYVWAAALLLSLLFGDLVTDIIIGLGISDRLNDYIIGSSYLSETINMGFRWDFILYSALPISLGFYAIFIKKIYTRTYLLLLSVYTYANAFWLLIIRSSFSNRFAYLSWFIYSIVLAYPLLSLPLWKKNQGLITALFLLGHLAFTIFMFV